MEKEPDMKEPQNKGIEVEEHDTKGPINADPERREIEPEKHKSERNEQDNDSGKDKDLKKNEVVKEEIEKKENHNKLKLQNPLDLEIIRQKATGEGKNEKDVKRQDSVWKTDDFGRQYQRSLSAGSSLFMGILLEAEQILKSPYNSKLSTLCKETFGEASFSRMLSSLVGNQQEFCLMVLSQLFPELSDMIEKMIGRTPEVRSDRSLILLKVDI